MSDGKSAVLTSALKRVDTAAYYFAEQVKNGTFQGGTMVFDASNDGIGFPKENPNLSDEIVKAMEDALAKIKLAKSSLTKQFRNKLDFQFVRGERRLSFLLTKRFLAQRPQISDQKTAFVRNSIVFIPNRRGEG